MLIGILGAMKIEVEALKEEIKNVIIERISAIEFYRGELWGHNVVVATCGVGKVNAALAAQALIMRYKPDLVINTGVAGGYSKELRIGDIVIGDYAFQHDVDTTAVGDPRCLVSGVNLIKFPCEPRYIKSLEEAAGRLKSVHIKVGTIATGDQFISNGEKLAEIADEFQALAFEMETGSIAQVCYINGVDFAAIRAISDNGNEDSSFDFFKFLELAAMTAVDLLRAFFEVL